MNFIGAHHLNLIQKTAIIAHVSSDLSAATARYLLNSNANVLGLEGPNSGDKDVTAKKMHNSTRSGGSSHFQFMYLDDRKAEERRDSGGFLPLTPETSRKSGKGDDGKNSGEDLMGSLKERMRMQYKRDQVEFLVLVRSGKEEGWERKVKGVVVEEMMEKGEGRVLFVSTFAPKSKEEKMVIEEVSKLKQKLEGKVNINVVVGHEICSKSQSKIEFDPEVEQALQDHIEAHETARIKGCYQKEKGREIANVVLFLCTQLGSKVTGAVMGIDGFSVAL